MRTRRCLAATVLALAALAGATLGACGSGPKPLRITGIAQPTGTDRSACVTLASRLPASLGHGLGRRALADPTPFAAAWGTPPVVLTCGVSGVAPSYRPTDLLAEVDGVGWYAEPRAGSVRYSTPTRRPHVVVVVPSSADAFDVLTSLAGPVAATTRSTTP